MRPGPGPGSDPRAEGPDARPPRPRVIAHRGASRERPENTLAAFALAVEQGADMIEIDLHRTRDGHVVVAHDARPAGLAREIGDATLAEVRALDPGGGERVPTLPEVLDAFGDRVPFNLELKHGGRGAYPGLEAAVLAELEPRGLVSSTLFSSFHDDVLARLRAVAPAARLGVLVSARASGRWLERARALGAGAVHFAKGLAGRDAIGAAHAAGRAVHVYTVDAEAEMRELLARGADGLFTNLPGAMRALVDALFPEGKQGRG